MAGAGSRFSNVGFKKPKPFIDVDGSPMIIRVLENLRIPSAHYILVARREHLQSEVYLIDKIKKKYPLTLVQIDILTEGTACTLLHARKVINNNELLLVANSDQIVNFDPSDFVNDCIARNLDGSILVFRDKSFNPKWSYARIDDNGFVIEVREKQPISEIATVGIYLFRRGMDFIDAAIDMILSQDRVNGEYYTCPCYNYLINRGMRIGIYEVSPEAMHGLGTPEDLEKYLKNISIKQSS